jgi:hypothetical protein
MKQFLDFDIYYVPPPVFSKRLKPFGYIAQAIRTMRIVVATKPDVVWVQSPPAFLPHLLLLLRRVTRRFRIVVDGHNAALAPPWSRFPATAWAMNRCDRVLVHNTEMRPAAEALGVRPEKIRVLEDPPPVLDLPEPGRSGTESYVLVPCSFNPDERAPIAAVLTAARLLPEVRFKITGRRRKAEALGFTRDPPGNVRFTDYLPIGEFEDLLIAAGVVLGVTSRQGCQLSAANEALGAHCALVLSDTQILREMFGEAALFAQNTPESLAETLREAIARREELRARSAALKTRRQASWLDAARLVTQSLR